MMEAERRRHDARILADRSIVLQGGPKSGHMTKQTQTSHRATKVQVWKALEAVPCFLARRLSRTFDHTIQSQSRNAYKVCRGGRCSVSLEQAHSVPLWDACINGFHVVSVPHFRSVWQLSGSTSTPNTPNAICFRLRFNVAKKRRGTVWHDNASICMVPKRTVLHSGRCLCVVCCIV